MRILSSHRRWPSSIYAAVQVPFRIKQWIYASVVFPASLILVRFNYPFYTLFYYLCSWLIYHSICCFCCLIYGLFDFVCKVLKCCVWLLWISFFLNLSGVLISLIDEFWNLNFSSKVFLVLEAGLALDPSDLCWCSFLIWWRFGGED